MNDGPIGQAVAKRDGVDRVATWVEAAKDDYGRVLPTHLNPSHWTRLASGLLRRNEKLAEAAVKNPDSFKTALLECARLGHDPGTEAFYFVPYGSEVVGIEGYQGEIERMYRAGGVTSVVCEVVREKDYFQWQPGNVPQHDADWFAPVAERGKLVGVYAFANLTGGGVSRVVVMSAEEVGKHRDVAKTQEMWRKWEEAMWRKTAIHELEKWVPTSSEYQQERLRSLAEADRMRQSRVVYEAQQVTDLEAES